MNTPETTKEAMLSLEVMRLSDRCKQLEADIAILRNYRRFQAACAAMQGLMSSTQTNFAAGTAEERKAHLANVSVEYADALLKELENEKS